MVVLFPSHDTDSLSKHQYRASPSWEAIRPFTIVFKNGARIYCKGLKDPESARGANLNWFWYDEGRRDPTGLGWKNAIAFLRIGKNPQAWCTTTMASLEHWTNTFFKGVVSDEIQKILDELKATGSDQNLFSIYKTSPKENDAIDPMFLASLLSAYPTGYLRQREIDGGCVMMGVHVKKTRKIKHVLKTCRKNGDFWI